MGFQVVRFETTPNPNAIKCILDRTLCDQPRSYRTESSAADDPIASALFAVAGVTNILMNADWVTVNKRPEVGWPDIKKAVKQVLRDA